LGRRAAIPWRLFRAATDVVSLFGSVTPVRPRKLLHVIFVVKEVLSETEDGAE
jgi:hypothetical protein